MATGKPPRTPLPPPDPVPIPEVEAHRMPKFLRTFGARNAATSGTVKIVEEFTRRARKQEALRTTQIQRLVEALIDSEAGARVRNALSDKGDRELRNVITVLVLGVLVIADAEPTDPGAVLNAIEAAFEDRARRRR